MIDNLGCFSAWLSTESNVTCNLKETIKISKTKKALRVFGLMLISDDIFRENTWSTPEEISSFFYQCSEQENLGRFPCSILGLMKDQPD